MADHAAMSPSSAAMWMNCPASITLADGRTRPSSRYAKEGTAAHAIAEKIIAGDLFPPGKITVEGDEFIVGIPMLKALNGYVGHIEDLMRSGMQVHVEQRVSIHWSAGRVWGTADCVAANSSILHVTDLKYGKGVQVKPDSAQLKIYALAAWDTLWAGHEFSNVFLTVFQPRIDVDPVTVSLSANELQDWGRRELAPAVVRVRAGDTTEVPGHWCRWCVRKADCVAVKSHRNSAAAEIFDDGG